MTKNHYPRSKQVSTRIRRGSVPMRKQASTIAFTILRAIETPKSALEVLGMSYSDFGLEYIRLLGGHSMTRQAVYKMLNAARVSDNALQVLGQLLSNHLTRICHEDIAIEIVQNSPLHITAYRHCDDCGAWYAIDRPDVKRCKKHRKA